MKDLIKEQGRIIDVRPDTTYLVKCPDKEILCYLSGKMRLNKISVLLDDEVIIEYSPKDITRGRVVRRM